MITSGNTETATGSYEGPTLSSLSERQRNKLARLVLEEAAVFTASALEVVVRHKPIGAGIILGVGHIFTVRQAIRLGRDIAQDHPKPDGGPYLDRPPESTEETSNTDVLDKVFKQY